jgi:hypothetical protein
MGDVDHFRAVFTVAEWFYFRALMLAQQNAHIACCSVWHSSQR